MQKIKFYSLINIFALITLLTFNIILIFVTTTGFFLKPAFDSFESFLINYGDYLSSFLDFSYLNTISEGLSFSQNLFNYFVILYVINANLLTFFILIISIIISFIFLKRKKNTIYHNLILIFLSGILIYNLINSFTTKLSNVLINNNLLFNFTNFLILILVALAVIIIIFNLYELIKTTNLDQITSSLLKFFKRFLIFLLIFIVLVLFKNIILYSTLIIFINAFDISSYSIFTTLIEFLIEIIVEFTNSLLNFEISNQVISIFTVFLTFSISNLINILIDGVLVSFINSKMIIYLLQMLVAIILVICLFISTYQVIKISKKQKSYITLTISVILGLILIISLNFIFSSIFGLIIILISTLLFTYEQKKN